MPADGSACLNIHLGELKQLAEFVRKHSYPKSLAQPAMAKEAPLAVLGLFEKLQSTSPSIQDLQVHFHFLKLEDGKAFVTGYYTPEFQASPVRTATHTHPLYMPPPDLRRDPHRYERKDIDERGMLAGRKLELAWLDSRLDAYLVQVQGSAMLRMPDGTRLRVNTADTNGLPYTSIGKLLIADGKIAERDISLGAIRAYFARKPGDLSKYLLQNRRYVFFNGTSTPPLGSTGAPVIPMQSLASERLPDGRYKYPPFMPLLLAFPDDKNPTGRKHVLAWNLDTGSAIKGFGRFDLYTGLGTDGEAKAGSLRHDATYQLLWPKNIPLPDSIAGCRVEK